MTGFTLRVLCCSAALWITSSLWSQDAELSLTDAAGFAALTADVEVFMDNDAGDIESYLFDVCNDELVTPLAGSAVLGSVIEDLEIDSHLVEYYEDGWSAAAVLEVDSVLVTGDDYLMYTITYELLEEGASELSFCGTYADPIVVIDGEDNDALTVDGIITVEEAPQFLRGDVNADGRVEALFEAHLLNVYLFDDGDEPPCLEAADTNDDGAVNIADSVLLLAYAVLGLAIPDPGTEECGPDSDGDLGCDEPADDCPADDRDDDASEDITLVISSGEADVDDEVTLVVSLEGNSEALDVFQFNICHDSELLDLDLKDIIVDDSIGEDGFVYVFLSSDGWSSSVLVGFLPPFDVIEVDDEVDLFEVTYTVLSEDPAVLEFCDDLDVGVDRIYVISESEYHQPARESGGVNLEVPAEFLRGDADDSASVSPLLDALFILQFGFDGGDEPTCMKAADVDDSGAVSALVDALFLLLYGFSSGDEPAAPGPDGCGLDETDDDLSCASEACL